jgi:radical SAM protein with 4Fe4S-binding SPASM domain
MPLLRQALHPLYRRLETAVHPLRYLFLEITRQCNLACLHCGSDCTKTPLHDALSTREWMAFLEQLSRRFSGKRDKPILVLTGGEPLLHDGLDAMLKAARAGGFPVGLVTNGYRLNATMVGRLVDRRVTSITVSLDGLRESHDWLRGRKGAYKRALRGIALLAESRIRLFDVVTCVTPRNLDELPALKQVLEERGVRRWRLFNIFPKGRAATHPELRLSADETRRMFSWIRTMRTSPDGSLKPEFACEGYLPAALDRAVRDEPYFCRAGISIGSVLSDGAVSACPNISPDLIQGNIRDDDLLDVWENRFEPFRDRRWMKQGACADCGEWRRCNGNSLHLFNFEKGAAERCYFDLLRHVEPGR